MNLVKYSFIIPVQEINDYIRDSIPKILEIKRDDFEIIIYPDETTNESWDKTRQVATGSCGPAEKRTRAITDAQGDVLIFIDDDAYPKTDFLDILDKDFAESGNTSIKKISAVAGPAMTPPDDSFWQKVSGAFFLGPLSGGFPGRYRPFGKKKFVDDWPTVNLSVRKEDFVKVGGFDTNHWPGEDTKFCLDLIEETGGKILYDPDLIVWHHRREGLLNHLKQVGTYGLHRGFFAKKYPKTSLKFIYFPPPAFFLFVLFGWLIALLHPLLMKLYFLGWILYALALSKSFVDILKYQQPGSARARKTGGRFLIALNAMYYIFLSHFIYGARFIQGLVFTKDLKSKLR